MATEVILPKVDMDMATGRISRWLVKEGSAVKQGDVLFEMETDKAAMEVEAPASGTLGNISAKEGIDVPVGQAVAYIYAAGEKPAAPAIVAAAPAPALSAAAPSGPAIAVSADRMPSASGDSIRATPLARRLAREAGFNLAKLTGSGPYGRILSVDIEKAKAAPKAGLAQAAVGAAALPEDATRRLFIPGSFSALPHDNMRRTIARRLVEAKRTVPHFYVTADCHLNALLKLRADLNAAAPQRDGVLAYKLSINDIVIKAWALALRDVPAANVSWTDDAMLQHAHADIGVAVSVPGGLITPIIRAAESKSLSAISAEMKDLAMRAKARKLKPEEYNGGSSAISNLGMYGVKQFAAIINPPHATILAVGAGEERAVSEGGKIFSANVMTVTLSTDHRAVDGALGAEVLACFKRYIENPIGMLI